MERTYEAPSNEAPHMILGYHQGRLVTYLQRAFFGHSKGPSSEPQPQYYTICLHCLSQSGITFGHLRLVQVHQNLPQYFRRSPVADSNLIFWIISPTMSPIYLDYFVKTTSPMYFWWRSWTWKSFRRTSIIRVRCIVNFFVSYLICMFQDSVPAGSYNDPFLSSV